MKRLAAWLRELERLPEFGDENDALRARLVFVAVQVFIAGSLGALLATLAWANDPAPVAGTLLVSLLVHALSVLLLRRARLRLAGNLVLGNLASVALLMMLRADGIYDVAIYTLPMFVFAASAILRPRDFAWFAAATLLAILAVGLLHFTDWFDSAVAVANRPNIGFDLTLFLVFTAVGTVTAAVFASQLRRLLERAHASEQRLLETNLALDHRVAERTADLEASTRELETFVYSISHDLRTPLRAISGYSRILLEDHRTGLGREESAMIERIEAAALRLSRMTDALLEYTRLNGKELERFPVSMQHLVESLRVEFEPALNGRSVEWRIGTLPDCSADLLLMRKVLRQLIGNALKFSAGNAHALIEVSGRRDATGLVYCVRDNGAGFDMQYSGKLFYVFQRLHGVNEFAGIGVGLATAQRIVVRHGGRLWAESNPGAGATFYLSLPA